MWDTDIVSYTIKVSDNMHLKHEYSYPIYGIVLVARWNVNFTTKTTGITDILTIVIPIIIQVKVAYKTTLQKN